MVERMVEAYAVSYIEIEFMTYIYTLAASFHDQGMVDL